MHYSIRWMIPLLFVGCYDEFDLSKHACDECLPCQTCVRKSGKSICESESKVKTQCGIDGHLHGFDSCGVDEGIEQECPLPNFGCQNIDTEQASCICLGHWTGDSCDRCLGNWDENTGCTTCENHWIDNSNHCGTCPGNWDPEADCAVCQKNWDAALDCNACLTNWDIGTSCQTCRNNWDEDNNCETCKSYWDPATDCSQCLPNWSGDNCEKQVTCIRYVNPNSDAEKPNGKSWKSAYKTIQKGIDAAHDAVRSTAEEDYCQVWVVQGIYTIYQEDEDDTVKVKSNVLLYGGFNGTEISLEERDWQTNKTVLDGQKAADSDDYVTHVVITDEDTSVDGFTITNGNANSGEYHGGGLYNLSDGVKIKNVIFQNNKANTRGGAVFNGSSKDMVIEQCEFRNNSAAEGGAVRTGSNSSLKIVRSVFFQNEGDDGGAVYISNKTANTENRIEVINSVFHENSARSGGAIHIRKDAEVELTNNVIVGNTASASGGGLFNDLGISRIVNSVFWNNTAENDNDVYDHNGNNAVVSYSIIDEAFTGNGNIHTDPLFRDLATGDFHLKPDSPCIDAAHGDFAPEQDLDFQLRHDVPATDNTGVGAIDYADIGVFEYNE